MREKKFLNTSHIKERKKKIFMDCFLSHIANVSILIHPRTYIYIYIDVGSPDHLFLYPWADSYGANKTTKSSHLLSQSKLRPEPLRELPLHIFTSPSGGDPWQTPFSLMRSVNYFISSSKRTWDFFLYKLT